jgi:fucose 4-O-acetylase-like acetyltransferase
MALKIVFKFVILLFIERFLGGSLHVMISLFLSLCKSLGISIIFIVLLLNGGEWCKYGKQHNYKRDTKFEVKYTNCF